MAPLPANDVYTWVPPIPPAVLNEQQLQGAGGPGSGNYQAYPANTGAFAPMYNYGWNCQTYLNITGVNITQTYSLEAPAEEEEAPKPTRKTKASK